MATIQPDILELKEKVARLEDLQQKLEVRVIAGEKAATWWRLFTATALPIVLTLFIAAWIQNGRFDELSKRLDEHSQRMDRIEQRMGHIEQRMGHIEQRMDRIEQGNQQILLKLQALTPRRGRK